jgi:hypothetical protein
MQRQVIFAAIGLFVAALSGCGRNEFPTYPVNGKLEFDDGTTPMFGEIEFFNEERRINARGKISRDGTFEIGTYRERDGAVEGKHKIVISQPTRDHLSAKIKAEIVHDHGDLVHPNYYDYRTSDLSCEVLPTRENYVHLRIKKHPAEMED